MPVGTGLDDVSAGQPESMDESCGCQPDASRRDNTVSSSFFVRMGFDALDTVTGENYPVLATSRLDDPGAHAQSNEQVDYIDTANIDKIKELNRNAARYILKIAEIFDEYMEQMHSSKIPEVVDARERYEKALERIKIV